MSTVKSSALVEAVEERAARYEVKHGSRELAVMLAQEQVEGEAFARQVRRAGIALILVFGAGVAVDILSLLADIV